ncbi:MAG TPA: 4'-phosphopantetheinyl transferase superfamily protein [Marinagarivorans sp.]
MPITITLHHIPSLLNELPLAEARQLLSREESTSAGNIKAERRLHEFIYGRYTLKQALAKHLNQPVQRIDLKKAQHGKLYIQGNPTHFNLTHSGEYLAYLICNQGPVGIDIEHPQRPIRDFMHIAERYFTAQESKALHLSANEQTQRALFYKIWTLKEAALKTVGAGISAGLERLDASAMNLDKPQTLRLADSCHSLWFDYWHHPLGINGVYLSAALEATEWATQSARTETGSVHTVGYTKPQFHLAIE